MATTSQAHADLSRADQSKASGSTNAESAGYQSANSNKEIRIALLGNPNTGKTTLFNRLCGLHARTANFPGITVDARVGHCVLSGRDAGENAADYQCKVVDLPGIYLLSLDLPEVDLCRKFLHGEIDSNRELSAALVVVDATNLARNLRLVAEVRATGHPVFVALNMIDIAQRRGLTIDAQRLSQFLGAPVVSVCAKSGVGVDELRQVMRRALADPAAHAQPSQPIPDPADFRALVDWADQVVSQSVGGDGAIGQATDTFTDRLDTAFTHPVLGIIVFGLIMGALFTSIFWIASFPMDLMSWFFEFLATEVGAFLPAGPVHDLITDGIITGVGSVVVFLPQIFFLFLFISILEDTGYLARAAFVMDRFLCRFGLPGQAFIPLLSSHACAIPGIMATKLIPDRKDRLATILVAPFMTCSARVPVYVILLAILFGDQPFLAGLAFFGCYVLGAVMAMFSAFIARRTILPGKSRPMVLELPTYKVPSVRTALYTSIDRSVTFMRSAGTTILAICVVLWWLSAYPKVAPPTEAEALRTQAQTIQYANPSKYDELNSEADRVEVSYAQAHSFIGQLGHFVEPVFRPIGFDWKISVGVLSSFAAREVFVSTMGILISGSDDVDVKDQGFQSRFKSAKRDDGSPVFSTASSASLLIFYVLAMQCLPTMIMTRKETGGWKWVALQWGYMSVMAYLFSLAVYNGLLLLGVS